jgi:hypothetical protein
MCIEKGGGMAKMLDKPSLYDTDFVAWLGEQAAHLRAGRLAVLDVENVAEELERVMRSQRQQLEKPPRGPDSASAEVGLIVRPARRPMACQRGGATQPDPAIAARQPICAEDVEKGGARGVPGGGRAGCDPDGTHRDCISGKPPLHPRAALRAQAAGGELPVQRSTRKKHS